MPMARSSVVKMRCRSGARTRPVTLRSVIAPSLLNSLRTRGEPRVVCRLRDDAHVRLHSRVARAADLRAENGVDAFAHGNEMDVQRGAGHGILFQAHGGNEESVDDIKRPQLQIDLAVNRQHKLTGNDVVLAMFVGGIEANGVAERGVHELGPLYTVRGIGAGVVKVPLELLRDDFDPQRVGCWTFKSLARPQVLCRYRHHDVESDE